MADDVTLPGIGTVVAADDVGGVLYQKMKLDLGGDGVTLNDSMGHDGPNQYQNFPVLSSASRDAVMMTGRIIIPKVSEPERIEVPKLKKTTKIATPNRP